MHTIRVFLSAFLSALLIFGNISYADVSSDISNIIQGTTQVYANMPGYYKVGERGYVGMGSLSIRPNVAGGYIQPFSITPPSIKYGCGAIDISMGGFSFLGFEYLVQKLQQILQAAPAFAFELALETFAPQINTVLNAVNSIADAINSININSCNASKAIRAFAGSFIDALNTSRTETAAGDQASAQGTGFWKTFADRFKQTDFWQTTVKPALDKISQASEIIKSLFSSTGSTKLEGCVFADKLSIQGGRVVYLNRLLKYTSDESYKLKSDLIGDLCVSTERGLKIDGGKGPSLLASVNNPSMLEDFFQAVKAYTNVLSARSSEAFISALSSGKYQDVSCDGPPVYVGGVPYDLNKLKFVCDLVNNLNRAIVDYYISVRDNQPISSTSAGYLNLIAAVNPGYVKLIRNSALLSDPSVLSYITQNVSFAIISDVVSYYLEDLVSEGCAEKIGFVSFLRNSLSNIDTSSKLQPPVSDLDFQASAAVISSLIDELGKVEGNVRKECSSFVGMLAKFRSDYLQLWKGDFEAVLENIRKTDEKLAESLKRRGLDFLYSYTAKLK